MIAEVGAEVQPKYGFPWRVPHQRYPAGTGAAGVNVQVVLTGKAIEESVDLAFEIFNRVFRRVLTGSMENEPCADDTADGRWGTLCCGGGRCECRLNLFQEVRRM